LPAEDSLRRHEILEVALDLFNRYGYHATTMTRIAVQAGISRSTLYAHFSTKMAILNGLYQDNSISQLVKQLEAGTTDALVESLDADPVQALEYLTQQFLVFFQDPRRIALLRLTLAEAGRFPGLQRAYYQFIATGLEVLSRYLSRLLPGLEDPILTTRLILGGLAGFILTRHILPGVILPDYPEEKIANMATRQFMYGLMGVSQAESQ
jgi:AcrR family transcriptional regulator